MYLDNRATLKLSQEIKIGLNDLRKDLKFRTNNQIIEYLIDFHKTQKYVIL